MAEKFDSVFEEVNPPAASPKKKTGGAGKITAGKFDVDITRPLVAFENQFAEAFECANSETGQNDHFALVMRDRFPVRKDVVTKCMSNDTEGLVNLRTSAMAEWADGTTRYVLVFKRPEGHSLLSHAQRREPISEEVMRRGIIRPISQTLQAMSNLGLFHGNIHPGNVFMNSHENAQAVLGECASSPAGVNQPILFETIERGMTDPESRGVGTDYDDIYSFGATVAVLMRGFNPMENKTDRMIIEEKINRGSYAVLTDNLRLSPGISEFLRATLNDDPRQRWDIDQLAAWVDGKRTTPKQSAMGLKAQRHLDFNGKKYIRPRLLAKDIYENPPEAVALIESGNLAKWVERAIGDASMVNLINGAIGRASMSGRTTGYDDRLLCYISMALDPQAPIRYKTLKVLPSGIGNGLAMAMLKNENVQLFGELIRDRYAWTWLNHKENMTDDQQELIHSFDMVSKMIIRRGLDYGIERCLYELSPDVPCLSDYFTHYYVHDCEVLLDALNKVAKDHKEQNPLDRHIASFITTRDSRDNSGLIALLEGSNLMKRSLALLTLYQQLQRRFNMNKVAGLTEWMKKDAEVVIQRFRSLTLKQEMLKQLPKEIASGNISKVLSLIDNPNQVRKDEIDYLKATRQYYNYGHERDAIRHELTHNPYYGFRSGRQVALFLSMALAVMIILATLAVHYGGVGS